MNAATFNHILSFLDEMENTKIDFLAEMISEGMEFNAEVMVELLNPVVLL